MSSTVSAAVALAVALIAQTGLVVTQVVSKRKSRVDRAQLSLDFMQDVADGLRAEIDRGREEVERERAERERLEASMARLRADARAARAEAREAHATAGTLYARVELLERLMNRAGVPFPPRHDDDENDTGTHPTVT